MNCHAHAYVWMVLLLLFSAFEKMRKFSLLKIKWSCECDCVCDSKRVWPNKPTCTFNNLIYLIDCNDSLIHQIGIRHTFLFQITNAFSKTKQANKMKRNRVSFDLKVKNRLDGMILCPSSCLFWPINAHIHTRPMRVFKHPDLSLRKNMIFPRKNYVWLALC